MPGVKVGVFVMALPALVLACGGGGGGKCVQIIDCQAAPPGCHYEAEHTRGNCNEQLSCGTVVCDGGDE
jgi:hypothetical protein